MTGRSLLPVLILSFMAAVWPAHGAEYYLLPSGAGTNTGGSWGTAFSISQLRATLNTTLRPGDTLYMGSGSYNFGKDDRASDIPKQFYIEGNSGTAAAPIKVIGIDTGTGLPLLVKPASNWNIYDPGSGQGYLIKFTNGSDYWHLENLRVHNIRNAVATSFDSSPTADQYVGLQFRNLTIDTVRNGFYLHNCDDLVIENVKVTEYSKRGITMLAGCDNGLVKDCYVDMVGTQDEQTWWTSPSESFPFGYSLDNRPEENKVAVGAFNTNFTFENCVSMRNRKTQPAGSTTTYWNGDGFVVETGHTGTKFIRCISLNNEDGGFDLKEPSQLTDCVAFMNARQYRCWYDHGSQFVLSNCVGGFPLKRGSLNGTGMIWASEAEVRANNLSFIRDGTGTCLETDLSAATIQVTDSIFQYTGAAGSYNTGSGVETFINSVKASSATVSPNFVNPTATWNGQGDDMNSLQYPNIGYSSLRMKGKRGETAWWNHYFGTGTPAGATAPEGDFESDGTQNLVEFGTQQDPTKFQSGSGPQVSTVTSGGESYLEMLVPKRPGATQLNFAVWVSSDLVSWMTGSPDTTILENTDTVLHVRDNTPVSAGLPRYMKLVITEAP